jgi:hypothetical protein
MKFHRVIFLIIILLIPNYLHAQEENEAFFTGKYFLSNGASSLNQSKGMVVWNLFGPQYYHSITKNIQIGVTSYWLLTPIALELQLSTKITDDVHVAGGGLYGLNKWAGDDNNPTVSLFSTITLGDRSKNLSATLYRFDLEDSIFREESDYNSRKYTVFNLSAYYNIKPKTAFVADFFYSSNKHSNTVFVIYGAQIVTKRKRLLHVGYMNYYDEINKFFFIPIPFLQLQVPIN